MVAFSELYPSVGQSVDPSVGRLSTCNSLLVAINHEYTSIGPIYSCNLLLATKNFYYNVSLYEKVCLKKGWT